MRTFSLLTSISLLLFSCTTPSKNEKIQASEWLLGQWENSSPEGIVTENWTKPNDSTLVATSFFIKEKDTLHFEKIVLTEQDGGLVYASTIKGQNNDQPIVFPLLSGTEKELVFENLQNEYPKKIKYTRNSTTSITIVLSGIQNKKNVTEQFKMSQPQ